MAPVGLPVLLLVARIQASAKQSPLRSYFPFRHATEKTYGSL